MSSTRTGFYPKSDCEGNETSFPSAAQLRADAPPYSPFQLSSHPHFSEYRSSEDDNKHYSASTAIDSSNGSDIERLAFTNKQHNCHIQTPNRMVDRTIEQEHYAQELRFQMREQSGHFKREADTESIQYRHRQYQLQSHHQPSQQLAQNYIQPPHLSHEQIMNYQNLRLPASSIGISHVGSHSQSQAHGQMQYVMIPGVGLRLMDVSSSQIGVGIGVNSGVSVHNITSQYATAMHSGALGIGMESIPLSPISLSRPIMQPQHQNSRLTLPLSATLGVRGREVEYNIPMESADGYIYKIQFKRAHRYFLLGPSAPRGIKWGDFVKVEADRGEDLGIVCGKIAASDFREEKPTAGYRGRGYAMIQEENKRLIRLATDEERVQLSGKLVDEIKALQVCREKVHMRKLPMEIKDAEYQFDHHKLTFFFEADRRIDFRELVSDLFALYKTRIWMQQIDTSFLPDESASYSLLTGLHFGDVPSDSNTTLAITLLQIQSAAMATAMASIAEAKELAIESNSEVDSEYSAITTKSPSSSNTAVSPFQQSPFSNLNSPYSFSPNSHGENGYYRQGSSLMMSPQREFYGESIHGTSPAPRKDRLTLDSLPLNDIDSFDTKKFSDENRFSPFLQKLQGQRSEYENDITMETFSNSKTRGGSHSRFQQHLNVSDEELKLLQNMTSTKFYQNSGYPENCQIDEPISCGYESKAISFLGNVLANPEFSPEVSPKAMPWIKPNSVKWANDNEFGVPTISGISSLDCNRLKEPEVVELFPSTSRLPATSDSSEHPHVNKEKSFGSFSFGEFEDVIDGSKIVDDTVPNMHLSHPENATNDNESLISDKLSSNWNYQCENENVNIRHVNDENSSEFQDLGAVFRNVKLHSSNLSTLDVFPSYEAWGSEV